MFICFDIQLTNLKFIVSAWEYRITAADVLDLSMRIISFVKGNALISFLLKTYNAITFCSQFI